MRFLLLALAGSLALPALAQVAPPAPVGHRLMFTPTARVVPAGQWRPSVTAVLIPNVSVGLGGGVSLGAGMLVGPEPVNMGVSFVESKVTLSNRRGLALALGATMQVDPSGDGEAFVVPHALATIGTVTRPGSVALTVGLGGRLNVRPVYVPVRFQPTSDVDPGPVELEAHRLYAVLAPAAWAGAEFHLTDRLLLLMEASALPDQGLRAQPILYGCPECDESPQLASGRDAAFYDLTLGGAVRIMRGRFAADIGAAVVRDAFSDGDAILSPAPWINLAVGLGR